MAQNNVIRLSVLTVFAVLPPDCFLSETKFQKQCLGSLPLAIVGRNAPALVGEDAIDLLRVRNVFDGKLGRVPPGGLD